MCEPKSVLTVDPLQDLTLTDSTIEQLPLMDALKEEQGLVELRFPNNFSEDGNEGEPLMIANILPKGTYWPFFDEETQQSTILKNVVFQRCEVRDNSTITDSLQLLNEEKNVLIIGNPGIGKTASMNTMLMMLINQIHQRQTEIRTIIVRMPLLSFRLTYTEKPSKRKNKNLVYLDKQKFEIEYIDTDKPLQHWEAYPQAGGATAILADVGEEEINPYFEGSVTGILTKSLRDVKQEVKTLSKASTPEYLLDPPSITEIEAISRIMYRMIQHDMKAMFVVLGSEHSVPNEQEFVDIISGRVEVVGALPRIIYNFAAFQKRLQDIASFLPSKFWADCRRVDAQCRTDEMSKFIGSYFLNGVPSSYFDQSNIETRAHSDALARRIAYLITEFSEWQLIERQFSTLAYQLQESAMIANGVLCNNCASDAVNKILGKKAVLPKRFEGWEFYLDAEIPKGESLAEVPWCDAAYTNLSFPNCTKVSISPDMLLKSRITCLSDTYAYRSSSKVTDRLDDVKSIITHNNQSVFLWQATDKDPAIHSIKLSSLEEVVRNLGLLEVGSEGSEYKVKFLMITSKYNDPSHQHGLRFTVDNDTTTYTLQEVIGAIDKYNLDPAFATFLKTRFEPWIVRAPFLPNIPENVCPGKVEVDGLKDLDLDELEALCRLLGEKSDDDDRKRRSKLSFLKLLRPLTNETIRAKLELPGSGPLTAYEVRRSLKKKRSIS